MLIINDMVLNMLIVLVFITHTNTHKHYTYMYMHIVYLKKVFLFVLPTNWTWLNSAMTSTSIPVVYEIKNFFIQKILPADQTDQ